MSQSKIDEINEAMLQEFVKENIEDTLDNRIVFLTGMRDAWYEDPEINFEKTFYMLAISDEIRRLKIEYLKSLS